MKKNIGKDIEIDYVFTKGSENLNDTLNLIFSTLINKRRKVIKTLSSKDFLKMYEYIRREKNILSDFIIYN